MTDWSVGIGGDAPGGSEKPSDHEPSFAGAPNPTTKHPLSSLIGVFLRIGITSVGGGRHAYFHDAFVVHRGWIRGQDYAEDFALAHLLPGSNFVNVALLCGYRLHSAIAAPFLLLLALLPGIVLTIILMLVAFGSSSPAIDAALVGVRIGATALLLSTLLRMRRESVRTDFDRLIAVACFALMILGSPLLLTIGVMGALSIWWRRPSGGRTSQ